ncbi:unnamed protein product [Phaedon cochleariae]|uniref:UDP-glucuronosyltransferase n=1 Tax=Phaedon cochleariae TaxID=80249 RepID=A0A9P0DR11_PHACE|nr:unnamed protein product [Phaedon cochleariae]
MMFKFSLAIFLLAPIVSSSRILGIIPTPSYSHQIAFHSIWKALALKGHDVVVITTDPVGDKNVTNLREIDVHSSYKYADEIHNNIENLTPLNIIRSYQNSLNKAVDNQLREPLVRNLIKGSETFDVVLVESMCPEYLAFAELYNTPKILVGSMETQSIVHAAMGNTIHPILYPEYFLPYYGELGFFERFVSSIFLLYVNYYRIQELFPVKDLMVKKHFGDSIPPISQMLKDVDMLLLNVNPVLEPVRPHGPNTIYYGGGVHLREAEPLPEDLKTYLDSATEGAIYISFGTHVNHHALKPEKISVIIETVRDLPYKILWKSDMEYVPEDIGNVKLIKWAPQQDVLRHPNIKLFITQGGLQSLEEAVFSHVPMVVLPFFGDQMRNAKRIVAKGIGQTVQHNPNLVKADFRSAIDEVITNQSYKENVKKLATLARDQPMVGVDTVIWWVEYVIRNRGAKHFKNAIVDLPLYQYFFLDVIAVIVVVISILVYLVWKLTTSLKRKLFGRGEERVKLD